MLQVDYNIIRLQATVYEFTITAVNKNLEEK